MSCGFLNAVVTIARRHWLIKARQPLTSTLELGYPCAAVLILLSLRAQQNEQHSQVQEQVLASPSAFQSRALALFGQCIASLWAQPVADVTDMPGEYGAWALIWIAVFLLPNLRFVQTIMEEKEYKVREFIQVYGASDFAYWCGHYLTQFSYAILQAVPITLLCWAMLPPNTILVGLFFLQIGFHLACVSLIILITALFRSTRVALFAYAFIYLLLAIPFIRQATPNAGDGSAATYFMLLSPPAALACGLDKFVGGFSSASLVAVSPAYTSRDRTDLNRYCSAHSAGLFSFLILDVILFLAIGWYLYQIRPGQFGVPKRWTFIFKRSYWSAYGREWKPRRKIWATPKTFHPYALMSDLFERNYKEGVVTPLLVVEEIHKIFRRVYIWRRFRSWIFAKLDIGVQRPPEGTHSLRGVSFQVYPDEVFCLMGRNGCGKTVLMSILSGFLDATSGNVTLNGYDVHRSVGMSRQSVGFSPQSTFFLDSMTVLEQFEFAARLKNLPTHEAACDIEVVLKMLEIYEKKNLLPFRLSEGEKKRVQIGMAFIGDPRVVIIDDLSTGLDVISKRIVWRAVRDFKKGRAVIITSHDPTEASFIADRLGVLEDGILKANGSPVFLKSRFESGYTLRVIETGDQQDSASQISDLVLSRCPNATSMNDLGVELVYKIPFADAPNLRWLLRDIERSASDLGVRDLSIGTTDLIEVLEKACDDTTAEAERRKARQAELISQNAWANYLTRCHDGGPASRAGSLKFNRTGDGLQSPPSQDQNLSPSQKSRARTTSQTGGSRQATTTAASSATADFLRRLPVGGRRVSEPPMRLDTDRSARSLESSHWSSLACSAETAQWSQNEFVARERGYIGNPTVFTEARAQWRLAKTAWNNFVRNVMAIFWKRFHCTRKDGWLLWVQIFFPAIFILLTSIFVRSAYQDVSLVDDLDLARLVGLPDDAGGMISNKEVQRVESSPRPLDGWNRVMTTCWIVMGCELIPSVWANYVTHERATGSKLHQHAAGIPLRLYWFGELMWNAMIFMLSGILVCLAQLWVSPEPFIQPHTYLVFLLALVLFGFSAACGAYFLSFFFNSGTTIQAVMIAGAVVIPGLVGAYHAINPDAYDRWGTFTFLLIPHAAFAQVCYSITFECGWNDAGISFECPNLLGVDYSLVPVLYMAGEIFVYFFIVVFIDSLHHDPHMKSILHKLRCARIPRLDADKLTEKLMIGRHFDRLRRKVTADHNDSQPDSADVSTVRAQVEAAPHTTPTKPGHTLSPVSAVPTSVGHTSVGHASVGQPSVDATSVSVIEMTHLRPSDSRRDSFGVDAERRRVNAAVTEMSRKKRRTSPSRASSRVDAAPAAVLVDGLGSHRDARKGSPKIGEAQKKPPIIDPTLYAANETYLREEVSAPTVAAPARCPPQENLLVVEDVSKWDPGTAHKIGYCPTCCWRRFKRPRLQHASFAVSSESVTGLVGLNGSGMSTLMNVLAGRSVATQGRVWIEGVDLSVDPYYRWGRIGFCSQIDSSLEAKMTGREILEMFGRINMIDRTYLRRTVIPEALQLVGLKDMKNTPVEKYSQGDKRKLSFILSLMTGPKILLLDSPSQGVDVLSRRRIWSVISKAKRNLGRAIVLASPTPEDCEALCDRVALLERGRIQSIGDLAFVKSRLGLAYEVHINVCAFEQFTQPFGHHLNKELTLNDGVLRAATVPRSESLQHHISDPRHSKSITRLLQMQHRSPHPVNDGVVLLSPSQKRRLAFEHGSSHSVVLDRAEIIIQRIANDLGSTYPGVEIVEILDTQARLLVPVHSHACYASPQPTRLPHRAKTTQPLVSLIPPPPRGSSHRPITLKFGLDSQGKSGLDSQGKSGCDSQGKSGLDDQSKSGLDDQSKSGLGSQSTSFRKNQENRQPPPSDRTEGIRIGPQTERLTEFRSESERVRDQDVSAPRAMDRAATSVPGSAREVASWNPMKFGAPPSLHGRSLELEAAESALSTSPPLEMTSSGSVVHFADTPPSSRVGPSNTTMSSMTTSSPTLARQSWPPTPTLEALFTWFETRRVR